MLVIALRHSACRMDRGGQDSVFGFMRWSASRTGSDINRVEEPFARANSSTRSSVSPLDFSSYPIASTESRIPLSYLQQIPVERRLLRRTEEVRVLRIAL